MKPLGIILVTIGSILWTLALWILSRIDARHTDQLNLKKSSKLIGQSMLILTLGSVVMFLALGIEPEELTTPSEWIKVSISLLCCSSIITSFGGFSMWHNLKKGAYSKSSDTQISSEHME